jgi:PAS domain S-box-containing protein
MNHAFADATEPGRRLRDTEALLKMAAGLGRLGAWAVHLDDGLVEWSDEVCAIHDLPPGFICTVEDAIAFYLPEDRPVIRAAVQACVQQARPFDLELRVQTSRGRTVWVRAIGEPERAPDGRVVRVRGAFQDITQQKAVAEENRQLLERLTMTLESLTEAFFTLDRQWHFTYMNAEAERVLKCPREKLLGRVVWDQFPGAVGTQFQHQYERALLTDVAVEFEEYYPPLGIWVQVRACPSRLGLAVSFRDVTERRRVRQELLRLNAELEQRVQDRMAELQSVNRDLEAFAYSIAHDLRAPMSAINGFAHALELAEGERLPERSRGYLRRIRSAGTQLEEMTAGLLALARLSRAAVVRAPVDLGAMATELLARWQEAEPDRQVEFCVSGNLRVHGDRVLLKQVLENLLGNAWKFTAGARPARIEFGVAKGSGGERVFFVQDDGAGFDMEYAKRLFEPFCRLHGQEEFEGTGIGLATVQKIISRHDGRIWARAQPGAGATFYFTLGDDACPEDARGGAPLAQP